MGRNTYIDVADAETMLRLVQSVPSPKAEPIKLWLLRALLTEVLAQATIGLVEVQENKP